MGDRRVGESGRGQGLAAEALAPVRAYTVVMEPLDGDRPLEPVVVPLEDFAHAAAAEESHDSVAADTLRSHDREF